MRGRPGGASGFLRFSANTTVTHDVPRFSRGIGRTPRCPAKNVVGFHEIPPYAREVLKIFGAKFSRHMPRNTPPRLRKTYNYIKCFATCQEKVINNLSTEKPPRGISRGGFPFPACPARPLRVPGLVRPVRPSPSGPWPCWPWPSWPWPSWPWPVPSSATP